MKTRLLATVSAVALVSAASAAELPVTKAPTAPAIWAGPYFGLNGGAVWHKADAYLVEGGATPDGIATPSFTATGPTLGAQIGYNWQQQNYVAGLEADINWVDGDGSATTVGPQTLFRSDLTWLATFRGRAGITMSPTLLYATAGLAVGGVENDACFYVSCSFPISKHETRVGWTAGVGIEHFISNPNMTVKAEVLYVDLGRSTAESPASAVYTGRFRNTAVVGRVGVNLKW